MLGQNINDLIASIPAILIAFAFHEWAHAATAVYLGDPTPRNQGRLTLNPFVHIDLVGMLLLLVFRFGWAKPVITNPSNYRGNKRVADLLVSAAGVIMNLLLAFAAMIAFKLILILTTPEGNIEIFLTIVEQIVVLNIFLAIFNLLPIPPLDGYRILSDLLPPETAIKLYKLEQYGPLLLLLVIFTGISSKIFGPMFNTITSVFNLASNMLLKLFGVG